MKLTLSAKEKKLLLANYSIEIERIVDVPAPSQSIVHGIGDEHLWDKIDRRWVYGNVQDYIRTMKDIGRRGTEYRNSSEWYECQRCLNEFGELNTKIVNGRSNIIEFNIVERHIDLRPKENTDYFNIVLMMRVKLWDSEQNLTGFWFMQN